MKALVVLSLRRSFDGGAWHGPSLAEALAGVDAAAALARPVAGGHTIWELTHHLAAWTREVARRMGGAAPGMPPEGDFPEPVTETDAAALGAQWTALRASLDAARDELLAAVEALPDDRMTAFLPSMPDAATGGRSTYGATLIGLAEHNAYHGGQIVLLRRAVDGASLSGYGPTAGAESITES